MKTSVCIAICSRQRPRLLARALTTLSQLNFPENVDVTFLVVENNETPSYTPLIAEMRGKMPLQYELEPTAGLTYARNKAIETVHALGADWMGCVDDDQLIDPDWLVHMVAATNRYAETAMFVGQWRRTELPGTPTWLPKGKQGKRTRQTGAILIDGAGGNTFIRSDVFAPDGMALRYDHVYRFLGGEDTDFSLQYRAKGGIIRHVDEAITSEDIPVERNDLVGRIKREAWMQSVLAKLRHKHNSPAIAVLWSVQIVYRSSVLGLANLVIAPIAFPFSRHWALSRYGVGSEFLSKAYGVLRYYFGGPLEEPYRKTLGH